MISMRVKWNKFLVYRRNFHDDALQEGASATSRSHVSVSENGACCTKIWLCKLSFVILILVGIIA
jgi:hypothetical protein